MSTKKEIWRLLEPGEPCNGGDEAYHHSLQLWHQIVAPDSLKGLDKPVRRRMTLPEPQGWISVKERMPTKEDANELGDVLWYRVDGAHIYPQLSPWSDRAPWFTHWIPIPMGPIDHTEDRAFKEAWANKGSDWHDENTAREFFLAGRKSVMTEKEEA